MIVINLRTARDETEHPREVDILARSVEFLPWAGLVNFVDEFNNHDAIVYDPETTKFTWGSETYDFCVTYPLEEVDRAWGVYDTKSERWLTVDGYTGQYSQEAAARIAGDGYIARELVISALPVGEPHDR